MEAVASEFFRTETYLPVARQQVCPFRIVEQWEQLVLGVVNVAGCIRDVFVCQHPVFVFPPKLKLEI